MLYSPCNNSCIFIFFFNKLFIYALTLDFLASCIAKQILNISSELWRRGAVIIITAQIHSSKPEVRIYAGSNSA